LSNSSRTPLTIFTCRWFEGHLDDGIRFDDEYRFLISKLLSEAKTDPFGCEEEALVSVEDGRYRCQTFPGMFPHEYLDDFIHPTALEVLMRQTEWSLSWNPYQIRLMCDFSWVADYPKSYVQYWVTSTSTEIKKDLEARTSFLQSFLANKSSLAGKFPQMGLDAIHNLIHSGGNTIALLTEHEYNDHGVPWVRHRFKKLILIREFMVQVLKIFLNLWRPYIADPLKLNEISIHAQRHNARTVHIWRQALEEASQAPRLTGLYCTLENTGLVAQADASINDNDQVTTSVEEDDWETEDSDGSHSGWETEEEWEEGYMLDAAVDRDPYDNENKQKSRPAGCSCTGIIRDYDEAYWSHVYSRISGLHQHQAPLKTDEGVLKRIAQASASFISSVLWR
jgi:hypothetical protein